MTAHHSEPKVPDDLQMSVFGKIQPPFERLGWVASRTAAWGGFLPVCFRV